MDTYANYMYYVTISHPLGWLSLWAGPPTFFTILTDSGVLTGYAVPKRVG